MYDGEALVRLRFQFDDEEMTDEDADVAFEELVEDMYSLNGVSLVEVEKVDINIW